MANMCSTTICFYGTNEQKMKNFRRELARIYDDLEEYKRRHSKIYCIVQHFLPEIDPRTIDCRGDIIFIDEDIRTLSHGSIEGRLFSFFIEVESAWNAKIEIWREIAKKYDAALSYMSSESGCNYYIMWDQVNLFDTKFHVIFEWEPNWFINDDFPTFDDLEIYIREYLLLPKYSNDSIIENYMNFVRNRLFEIYNLGIDAPNEVPFYIYEYEQVSPTEFEIE